VPGPDLDLAATADDITGRMLAAVIRSLRSGHDSDARGRLSARLLLSLGRIDTRVRLNALLSGCGESLAQTRRQV
jgi:hypothetical protein